MIVGDVLSLYLFVDKKGFVLPLLIPRLDDITLSKTINMTVANGRLKYLCKFTRSLKK